MAEILKVDRSFPEPRRITRAAELLRKGEVIAIPTDTFYGLAANPFDLAAVEKVFRIKGRPEGNPLLLLVDSIKMAQGLAADPPPQFHALAKHFWPGPLTIVVKASPKVPDSVTAHTGRVGLRLPAAAIPLALIRATGSPITGTSANVSGEPDPSSAEQVASSLNEQLPLILDGGSSREDKSSTVLSLNSDSWDILREGAISRATIEAFFNTNPPAKKKQRK